MAEIEFGAGEVIFKQGYPGRDCYVIESGRVEIYSENSDGTQSIIATLGPGQMFGEYAPMENLPRSASARAIENTVVQVITLEG